MLVRLLAAARGSGSFLIPMTSFHGALAYRAGTVTWNDQTNQAMSLTSEEFDTDGYHDNATNPERITIPSGLDGYYLVHASAYVSGTPSQDAPIYIKKNGTTVRGGQTTPYTAQPNSVGGVGSATAVTHMVAGDYVEGWVYVDNNGGGGTYPVGHATDPGLQMSLTVALIGT